MDRQECAGPRRQEVTDENSYDEGIASRIGSESYTGTFTVAGKYGGFIATDHDVILNSDIHAGKRYTIHSGVDFSAHTWRPYVSEGE